MINWYQRDNFQNEDGTGSSANEFQTYTSGGNGGARFNNQQQANFNTATAGGMGAGTTPFDPQALAALYTHSFRCPI